MKQITLQTGISIAFAGIVWYSQLKMAEAAAASSAVGEFFCFSIMKVEKTESGRRRRRKNSHARPLFSSLKKTSPSGSGGSETARERERGAETIPLTTKPAASPKTVGLVGVGKDARA